MMPSNKAIYDMKYQKEKIKRVQVNYQLDDYNKVKAAADAANQPIATYIKQAVQARIDSGK